MEKKAWRVTLGAVWYGRPKKQIWQSKPRGTTEPWPAIAAKGVEVCPRPSQTRIPATTNNASTRHGVCHSRLIGALVASGIAQNGQEGRTLSVSEGPDLPSPESRKVLGPYVDAQVLQRPRAEVAVVGPLDAGCGIAAGGVGLDAVDPDAQDVPEQLADLVFGVLVLAGELENSRERRRIRGLRVPDRNVWECQVQVRMATTTAMTTTTTTKKAAYRGTPGRRPRCWWDSGETSGPS